VMSNLEIFEEIAADAGLFFDPSDPKSFARQIEKLGDSQRWSSISKSSVDQAAQFSWEASAKQLLELLNRV
jgi:glycosyltransferase involved in cell wall biosynthesis